MSKKTCVIGNSGSGAVVGICTGRSAERTETADEAGLVFVCHLPNGEYAMPSGPAPVGMYPTTVPLAMSIIATRELP